MPAKKKKKEKIQQNKELSSTPQPTTRPFLFYLGKTVFWFGVGMALGLFLLTAFGYLLFRIIYNNTIYPGVYINGVNFGGKTQNYIIAYFDNKNKSIQKTSFTLTHDDDIATISAKNIHLGFDSVLLAKQAYTIGRSQDNFTNAATVFQAYIAGVSLSPAYTYSHQSLMHQLEPIRAKIHTDPVEAIFTFENGRVSAFRPSSNGQDIDASLLEQAILAKISYILANDQPSNFTLHIPIVIKKPKVATSDANNLGIKELIGSGTSLFQHSIPGRIYNVELAASRVNGALVAPGEEFSFAKTVGDVSSFTGYQQAYVIQNGKTVLGDGGGVCQVSTTLFRAVLNAGLPIVERHAHAYRVGYYEEDSPPGIDATVYVPNIDFRFKNDTSHYILIQTAVDPSELRLTFYLYGQSDGRSVQMTTPVISNIISAPDPIYTDDPTLPQGTLKQVDFSANGATVKFSRTVMKDGKVYLQDNYTSVYQPWAAAYLRGTGPAQ